MYSFKNWHLSKLKHSSGVEEMYDVDYCCDEVDVKVRNILE